MIKTVRLTRHFKTDIETLFDLWTKPEHLKRWHHPHPTLFTTPEATVDLRVGGTYTIIMQGPDGRRVVGGEFTEIQRPTLLAYTWQWEGSDEVSNVRIAFHAAEDGTKIILTHVHLDTATSAEAHHKGWEGCLGVLETITNKENN